MKPFFDRLVKYYEDVGKVLRGEADAAAIFPNSSDVGISREKVYIEFLKQHAPSKCNIFQGGFIFDTTGNESKQMDVIATTDTAPRFDFHNRGGDGKSFSPVEGTLGAFSIKSTLDKKELFDALTGIASIPNTSSLEGRVNPLHRIWDYDDWPLKVIYANNGISAAELWKHLHEFYAENDIPFSRRPNFIHVAGKYLIVRIVQGMAPTDADGSRSDSKLNTFWITTDKPDVQAINWTIAALQSKAMQTNQIAFDYSEIVSKVVEALQFERILHR